jgi:hypothetical protein
MKLLAAALLLPSLALADPGRAAWMRTAKWGVMSHFLADWRAEVDGEPASVEHWNDLIDHFDVETLADQLKSAGAGWFQISIGQNSGYYLSPNPVYDRITGIRPSKCSRRDLVADLAEALGRRGIRLMVYLPSGGPGQDHAAVAALEYRRGPNRNAEFQRNWEAVIAEWSRRWGTKVSGWWFDGCYWPSTMYRTPDPPNFRSFAAAARAGNPDAAVAFNPGVVYRTISLTPNEDYTAGEIDHPEKWTAKRNIDGKIDGDQIQVLTFLGQAWGKGEPRFSAAEAIAFTKKVQDVGGVVTWDTPIRKDGTYAPEYVAELKAIGAAVRGAPVLASDRNGAAVHVAGRNAVLDLDPKTLAIHLTAAGTRWDLLPASRTGLRLRFEGRDRTASLADAKSIAVAPWNTGARHGVKLTLSNWGDAPLTLHLTVAFEEASGDLVFDLAADESRGAVVRRLDWPEAVDPKEPDDVVLSNIHGVLLPRDYAQPYNPIRDADPNGTSDHKSEIQSNIIEDWSMSWWGYERSGAGLMAIVETPDDAAYRFSHPPGGPTVIGPRWRPSLGRLGYLRSVRYCFLPGGGYVAMAKRYRQYAQDAGLFVSLREKAARTPEVQRLIGAPMMRARTLTNVKPGSNDFNRLKDKALAHSVITFDQRAALLRQAKTEGWSPLTVVIAGWPHFGYDRQHPDALPPSPEAGGWDGLKRLADTSRDLGFPFSLHDQYRDYYVDAPSFSPEFAIHEEDAGPAEVFPGTRFGDWKEGTVPFMDHWEGGKMSYLNPRLMLEHLKKNYQALFDHGIHPDGTYIDVFGYVPPDEDFNPEHPTTRTDGRLARIDCFNWCREHLGFVGTEAGCDWTVPYVDFCSPERERKGIPIPLYGLVYHDAIITAYDVNDLRGFLNAGLPQVPLRGGDSLPAPDIQAKARRMAALQKRLAFVEMTSHEFLDGSRTKERTTWADGTTVTVDWTTQTVVIAPDL